MANKKITLQHWYTTGSTTAPTGLIEGEIAISHARGQEAIFIMPDENDGEVKFIPKTQIVSLINTKLGEAGVATEGVISALTANLENHITGNTADSTNLGHVKLVNENLNAGKFTSGNWDGYATGVKHTHSQYLSGVTAGNGQPIVSIIEDGVAKIGLTTGITKQIESGVSGYTKIVEHETKSGKTDEMGHVKIAGGDLSGNTGTTIDGVAAASYHTHGQYLEKRLLSTNNGFEKIPGFNGSPSSYGIKAGTGITVDSNGVSINDEYQGKIASGATAYEWGNHKDAGYADNNDLTALRNNVTAHTVNTTAHITREERTNWNNAANRINTFLDVETGATEALDSLHEIQEYLTGDGNSVKTLLESLNNLTDTVSGNTDDITTLKQNFEENGTVTVLQSDVERKVEKIDVSDNLSAVTGTTSTGSGVKKYTITHTPASTQASAITANNTADFSFGSNFSFVTRIGYDANGHVVSGSTQTLRLPELPAASADTAGIVKIKYGALGIEEELLPQSTGIAADVSHYHTQYVKYHDLSNYNGSEPLVISCGTY